MNIHDDDIIMNVHVHLLLMPPGAMSSKIQVFFFFFSVENVQVHWIFGITWCVFLSRANSTVRCRRCFVAEFFQVYVVFLVVAIFAKTECYSPSNLLVHSVTYMYRTSVMYQLSTCQKWYVASFQAFHDHFSYETYKHHASTVTCSESKWKNPPSQNDHSTSKANHSLKIFFRINHHIGAWVHWQCQSCYYWVIIIIAAQWAKQQFMQQFKCISYRGKILISLTVSICN